MICLFDMILHRNYSIHSRNNSFTLINYIKKK